MALAERLAGHYCVPTESIGSHSVGKEETDRRTKRWATRARTGCLTCRARHIRCDEGKPTCQRCTKGGLQCRGYTVDAPPTNRPVLSLPRQSSATEDQSNLSGWAQRGIAQRRHNIEPEPPHWELIEATRYYFHYVQPLVKGQALPKRVSLPAWNGPSGWSMLMRVSTHRLNATYRANGKMVSEDNDPSTSGAWTVYRRQMAYLLGFVNEGMKGDLRSQGQNQKEMLLRRLYNLVFYDLAVNASAWRLHILGYLALVPHLGGVRALMRDNSYHLNASQWSMLNVGISINTTSPASMQLRGFEAYTDADVTKLAGLWGNQSYRTPASLLIATKNISQLRSHAADNTYTDAIMENAARDLLNGIIAFDGVKWAHDMKYIEVEKIAATAHIFQEAILLYGILSLPRFAVVSWSEAGSYERLSETSTFDNVLISHRHKLLDLLYPYRGSFESRLDMNWALLVAGVSLGGGDGGSVEEERKFVIDSMLGIWRNPITRCSPIICIERLRTFWASGKTGWDDCFYEPTPCLG